MVVVVVVVMVMVVVVCVCVLHAAERPNFGSGWVGGMF